MAFLSHHNQHNSGGINQQNNIDNSTHINVFNGSNKSSQDPNENVERIIVIGILVIVTTALYKMIIPKVIKYNWIIVMLIFILAIINIIYAFKEFSSSNERIVTIVQAFAPIAGQMIWVKLNPQKKVTDFLQAVKADNISEIYKDITPIINAAINGKPDILFYIFVSTSCFYFCIL